MQLHWLQIKQFPEVFAALDAVGLTSLGGCGDSVRNITGCPVAGLDADELFDCRPELDEVVQYFLTERDYFDLPRKHKITISSVRGAVQRARDQLHRLHRHARRTAANGFSLRVGGGLSSTPRLARDLDVFVPQDEALPGGSKAILDVWRTDLRYRLSRAKARLKFLVDDYGAEGVREAVREAARPHARAADGVPRPRRRASITSARTRRSRPGCTTSASRSFSARSPASRRSRSPTWRPSSAATSGWRASRTSSSRNVPEARVDEVIKRVAEIGFPLDINGIRGAQRRLHRSAAVQLRGGRDQDQAQRDRRCAWRTGSGATSRARSSASTAVRTRAPTTG